MASDDIAGLVERLEAAARGYQEYIDIGRWGSQPMPGYAVAILTEAAAALRSLADELKCERAEHSECCEALARTDRAFRSLADRKLSLP